MNRGKLRLYTALTMAVGQTAILLAFFILWILDRFVSEEATNLLAILVPVLAAVAPMGFKHLAGYLRPDGPPVRPTDYRPVVGPVSLFVLAVSVMAPMGVILTFILKAFWTLSFEGMILMIGALETMMGLGYGMLYAALFAEESGRSEEHGGVNAAGLVISEVGDKDV